MKIIIELDDNEIGRPLDPKIVRNRAEMIKQYLERDENIRHMTTITIKEKEQSNEQETTGNKGIS
jgi:hypothetical protein